jgi:hypothetical protein
MRTLWVLVVLSIATPASAIPSLGNEPNAVRTDAFLGVGERWARQSDLARALERSGYSALSRSERSLSIGVDISVGAWRAGYQVIGVFSRHGERPGDAGEYGLKQLGVTLHAGYDFLESGTLYATPLVGFGWQQANLEISGLRSPFLDAAGSGTLTLERNAYTFVPGFAFGCVVPFQPPRGRRWPKGLLFGFRFGYGLTLGESDWTSEEPSSFDGPDLDPGGPHFQLTLGIANIR